MMKRKKKKKRFIPVGKISCGGVIAMLFSGYTPNPLLTFCLGGVLVLSMFVVVFVREGDDKHIGFRHLD